MGTSDAISQQTRTVIGLCTCICDCVERTCVVSVWDSDEHAAQMNELTEMTVDARGEMEAVGVTFIPIVNYPINWTI